VSCRQPAHLWPAIARLTKGPVGTTDHTQDHHFSLITDSLDHSGSISHTDFRRAACGSQLTATIRGQLVSAASPAEPACRPTGTAVSSPMVSPQVSAHFVQQL